MKKIISFIIILALTMSLYVPASAAETTIYYQDTYTTAAAHEMLTIKLGDFMANDGSYEFSFNVKPETVDVHNAIRVDLGFQGDVTSAGNYGIFYLYDNGTNALGTSDYNKIGKVGDYKDYVAENGVDMKMLWNTETGKVDITADFGEKEYSYTYTPGVVEAGGSFGKLIIWSESTTVTVTDLTVKWIEKEYIDPNAPLYEKDEWVISGEHNYLHGIGSSYGVKADGKYTIEFDVTAPTGNPSFYFDWRDYANNTKSACKSWNYTALAGIYDDGSNDCLALGVAPSWVGTLKRDGQANQYHYSIVWDVAASKFDMTLDYKKTSDGTSGTYTKSYTSTNAFRSDDVLKFATGSGTATIKNLKITNWKEPEPEPVPDPEPYYLASHTTTGAGNILSIPLDDKIKTGELYELFWNIKPENIDGQSVRCDIMHGHASSQGNHGFFLLYNGGTDALGMSDWGTIGDVEGHADEVALKGIDIYMLWDTAQGKADITVTFPTGKLYTYTWNAGVIAEGQKYGNLLLQSVGSKATITELNIRKFEVRADEQGYYYKDNFDLTTSEEWTAKYAVNTAIVGQVTYAWSPAFYTEENGNNAIKLGSDVFLFDSTPKKGAYVGSFDIKPLEAKGEANTEVMQMDLAGSWMRYADVILLADENGDINKLNLMGQTMDIDPTRWISVKLVKNFETKLLTVTVSQDGKVLKSQRTIGGDKISKKSTVPVLFDNAVVTDYHGDGVTVASYKTNIKAESADVEVTFDVSEPTEVSIVAAVYTNEGALKTAQLLSKELTIIDNKANITLYDEIVESDELKVYLWDSMGGMKPLTDATDLEKSINLLPVQEKVDVRPEALKAYMQDDCENVGDYADGNRSADIPYPVVLDWSCEDGSGSFTVLVSENRAMTDSWEFETDETSFDLYNTKTGTKYYWQVISESGLESEIGSFETADESPRLIYADGAKNFRDIGGWKTEDGKRVKQGLVYRSLCFEYPEEDGSTVYYLTEKGIATLTNQVGIKTEIDFRTGTKKKSILGDDIGFYKFPMNYDGDYLVNNKAAIKGTFNVLADSSNYPVVYHCQAGADRTGAITYLLNGLLGVSKEDLFRDYLITNFSAQGGFRPMEYVTGRTENYVKTIDEYEGNTISEKVYNYLVNEVGISAQTLDLIRNNLIEK